METMAGGICHPLPPSDHCEMHRVLHGLPVCRWPQANCRSPRCKEHSGGTWLPSVINNVFAFSFACNPD